LIKELTFVKTTGQLQYQLAHDQDVLGPNLGAATTQAEMNDDKTTPADRQEIIKALTGTVTKDQFWGTRVEAATSLSGLKEARDALLAAARMRMHECELALVTSLAATKDPTLADAYQPLLNDQSYAVIRARRWPWAKPRAPGPMILSSS